MRRTVLVLTMALAMVLACAGVVLAQGSPTPTTPAPEQQNSTANALPEVQCASTKAGPPITVMTRNLYLGADLDPVFKAAKTGGDVVGATTTAWNTIKETNFPERAEALADEMDASDPLLVGLQEVTLFRTGPPDSFTSNPTPATHVEYDYLKILLRELYERGLRYVPVTITKNADGELPGFTAPGVLQDIRLTDRDVILVRMNLPGSMPQLANPQTGNFAKYVSAPLPLLRGWGSIDVTLRGQTFRFINTHLEPESTDPDVKDAVNAIQVAQGDEILSGPANTDLPVILVGDFNSQADTDPPPVEPPGTPTYRNLIEAGLADAWRVTHPGETGYTWGQAENLRNVESNLSQRLDLVLFRDGLSEGGLCALDADVVGDDAQNDRTPSGLWPSDHAGVVATLRGE